MRSLICDVSGFIVQVYPTRNCHRSRQWHLALGARVVQPCVELNVGVSRHSIFTRKAIKQYMLKPLTLMTNTHESVDFRTILL